MVMKWIKLLVISMVSCLAFASCEKEDELKVENDYAEINRVEGYVKSIQSQSGKCRVEFSVAFEGSFKWFEKGWDSDYAEVYVCVRYGENADMSDSYVLNLPISAEYDENGDRTENYTQLVDFSNYNVVEIDEGKKYYYQAYVEYYMPNSDEKFVVYDEIRDLDLTADRIAQNVNFTTSTTFDYYYDYCVNFNVKLSGDPLGFGRDMMTYIEGSNIEVGVRYGGEDLADGSFGLYYDSEKGCYYGDLYIRPFSITHYQPYAIILGVKVYGDVYELDTSGK